MFTTVGRLYPVAGSIGLALCQPLITSKQSDIPIPVLLSPLPSKPLIFTE